MINLRTCISATHDNTGKLHSYNDEPAAIYDDGTKKWYHHGKLHREMGKPAVIGSSGRKEYHQHGMLENSMGPSVIDQNGKYWWFFRSQKGLSFEKWLEALEVEYGARHAALMKLKWSRVA